MPGGPKPDNIGTITNDLRRKHRHPREKVVIVEEVKAWMAETGLPLSRAAGHFQSVQVQSFLLDERSRSFERKRRER
jgi:hypothetical protein